MHWSESFGLGQITTKILNNVVFLSRKPLAVFLTVKNPFRFSGKTLERVSHQKPVLVFSEIPYGFFTLCEKPLWVF
jgi:hypothetical protein